MAATPNEFPEPPKGYQEPYPEPPKVQQPDTAVFNTEEMPKKRRVHHTYVWLGSLHIAIPVFIAIFITTFGIIAGEGAKFARGTGSTTSLLLGVVVVVMFVVVMGIVVLFQLLSYKHLSYELGEEEFSLYSGIFNKKRVHVPYQRIQSVNQRASILQRIFGVCTINIDTAGGSNNKSVLVPYVQNFEAEHLRKELFARKQWAIEGAPTADQQGASTGQKRNVLDVPAEFASDVRGVFGAPSIDTGNVSYEYGMSNKELILTGLSNSTGSVILMLTIIGSVVGLASQLLQTAIGRMLAEEGYSWATRITPSGFVWFVVGALILFFVIIWIFSVIGTCISYGGFRACRRQSRIEVERGLLQHQFHGVDINRVQAVVIKQGFIRRIFGYCELSLSKIDAAAADSSEQNTGAPAKGLVIHPFVKLDRIPEILAGLVPEFSEVPTEQIKLPAVSLRRGFIRRCIWHGTGFWLAVVVAIPHAAINIAYGQMDFFTTLSFAPELVVVNSVCILIYVMCLVAIIFEAIGSVLWFKGSSFAYNHKFMQITNGGFSRESVSFPRQKIQYGTIRTNPFQRMSQVATIQARTAAGIGGTTLRLLDVSTEDAQSWLDWVVPQRNMIK